MDNFKNAKNVTQTFPESRRATVAQIGQTYDHKCAPLLKVNLPKQIGCLLPWVIDVLPVWVSISQPHIYFYPRCVCGVRGPMAYKLIRQPSFLWGCYRSVYLLDRAAETSTGPSFIKVYSVVTCTGTLTYSLTTVRYDAYYLCTRVLTAGLEQLSAFSLAPPSYQ